MGYDGGDRLRRALDGGAWSMAGLLFGADRALDEEGRPIAERRAPSAAKAGVPMELATCPYHDARRGQPMNASALEQIKRYLKPVYADVAGFHAALGSHAAPGEARGGWTPFALAVIDQLGGPARHLLAAGAADAPVPARVAVGYKLAAGYFEATRRLIAAELEGRSIPPGVDALMELVRDENLLVGASEVCAGPPKLIRRTARVLLGDGLDAASRAEAARVTVADALLAQIRLGLAWRCFDEAVEQAVFDAMGDRVRPANPFMEGELRAARDRLAARRSDSRFDVEGVEVPSGDAPCGAFLRGLRDYEADAAAPAPELEASASRSRAALRFDDPSLAVLFARRLRAYLSVRRRLLEAQWSLERRARVALGVDLDAPLALDGLIAPPSRARRWLEAGIGRVAREGDVFQPSA